MPFDRNPEPATSAEYRPWVGRKFGVEMEMRQRTRDRSALDQAAIVRALQDANVPLGTRRGYFHSDGSVWDVKTDSSCGWEVATRALTMTADGECEELRRGCDRLAALSPQIDRTCGLHVHVDLPDYTWEDMQRLISLWARYEPFFYGLMPPSRWNNSYCYPICRSTWTQLTPSRQTVWTNAERAITAGNQTTFNDGARGLGRGGLNLGHWFTSARVEFRLGAGSVDYAKIRNWVLLLLATANRVKQGDMPSIGPYTMIRPHTFPTLYIGKVLGLVASDQRPNVPEDVSSRLMGWAEMRRVNFQRAAGIAAAL
jgi:hypothetical protein